MALSYMNILGYEIELIICLIDYDRAVEDR